MTALRRHDVDPNHDRDRGSGEPGADGDAGGAHDFDGVEARGDGLVLRCSCGWASAASRSAEVVGTAWDRHRSEVGASDW